MTTFTKLRDGSWGVKSTEKVEPGQTVPVTKKDGAVVPMTIRAIVWAGEGVWLCSVETASKPAASAPAAAPKRASRPAGWRPCGYPGCNPRFCDECDGEGGGAFHRHY